MESINKISKSIEAEASEQAETAATEQTAVERLEQSVADLQTSLANITIIVTEIKGAANTATEDTESDNDNAAENNESEEQ